MQDNTDTTVETTTATTAPAKTRPASLTISDEAKAFVAGLQASYEAPGKTPGKMVKLTEAEAVDAMVEFITANREQLQTDDSGNVSIVDLFDLEVRRTLALREGSKAKVRESVRKENESLKAQLAALEAKLAALAGGGDSNPY